MPRKSRVELSSRPIDVELFEPYHEHLDEYCRLTQSDKTKLIEGFIRSLEVPDSEDFGSVDERILSLFQSLRPNGKHESKGRAKTKVKKKVIATSSPSPATPMSTSEERSFLEIRTNEEQE